MTWHMWIAGSRAGWRERQSHLATLDRLLSHSASPRAFCLCSWVPQPALWMQRSEGGCPEANPSGSLWPFCDFSWQHRTCTCSRANCSSLRYFWNWLGLCYFLSSLPPFFCLCALEIGDSLRHQPNTISQTLSEPPEYTKVPGLSVIFFYFNILTQVLTQFPPPQIPNNPKLWVINWLLSDLTNKTSYPTRNPSNTLAVLLRLRSAFFPPSIGEKRYSFNSLVGSWVKN